MPAGSSRSRTAVRRARVVALERSLPASGAEHHEVRERRTSPPVAVSGVLSERRAASRASSWTGSMLPREVGGCRSAAGRRGCGAGSRPTSTGGGRGLSADPMCTPGSQRSDGTSLHRVSAPRMLSPRRGRSGPPEHARHVPMTAMSREGGASGSTTLLNSSGRGPVRRAVGQEVAASRSPSGCSASILVVAVRSTATRGHNILSASWRCSSHGGQRPRRRARHLLAMRSGRR